VPQNSDICSITQDDAINISALRGEKTIAGAAG